MLYGLFYKAVTNIYEIPNETKISDNKIVSAMSDEGLHGMGVAITGPEINAFIPVKTHYQYSGYVKQNDLLLFSKELIQRWEDSELMVISNSTADILSIPKVQGFRIMTLTKGALVKVYERDVNQSGWAKVGLANGQSGYVYNQFLAPKKFSQSSLWENKLPQINIINENDFREGVILEASKYENVQYRWGGKTTYGIDCSGLVSMCYMLNGILIYRDAKLIAGYPVKEIPFWGKKKGDLLYFPGHIAIYLGNDYYIHATARKNYAKVVINSLNPNDSEYLKDLADSLYAVGSIFPQ